MAGSLEFIKNVNGSSNVSLIEITNVFSVKYDIYKVVTTINTDTNQLDVPLRLLDSGGSEINQAEYDSAFLDLRSSTTFGEGRNVSDTEIVRPMRTGNDSAKAGNNVIYFHNPFDSSSFTFIQYQASYWDNTSTQLRGAKAIAVHKSAETISGFKYFVSSNNITSHNVTVYGVK